MKLHCGPQRASWCWWHSCQLWAECSVSAVLGLASNRQEESRAHTHTPYRKKAALHTSVRPPVAQFPICCDQIVFQVSVGEAQSPAWTPLLLSVSQWLSGEHTQIRDYNIQTRQRRVFIISCFNSVSVPSFCFSSANEKIEDINGCPKSRSQMVSDLLSLFWQNTVTFTSLCVWSDAALWCPISPKSLVNRCKWEKLLQLYLLLWLCGLSSEKPLAQTSVNWRSAANITGFGFGPSYCTWKGRWQREMFTASDDDWVLDM